MNIRMLGVVFAVLVATGCGDKWSAYIDAFLELQQRRANAEEAARTVKATFAATDPAYVNCKALYETARRENTELYLALAGGMARSKSFAQTGFLQIQPTALDQFLSTTEQLLAERRQSTAERGLLTGVLKVAAKPLKSVLKLSVSEKSSLAQVVEQVRAAVLWLPWERVV